MSQNSQDQEPSIEEILASIRQIISDDDEDDKKEEVAVEEPLESPVDAVGDDILELSEEDLVEEVPEEIEEPVAEEEAFEDEPEDIVEDEPEEDEPEPMEIELRDRLEEIRSAPKTIDETPMTEEPEMSAPKTVPSDILSSATQAAALGSLSKLATKMPINSSRAYDGVTLEDIVREMLHPMLREWMDDNLAPMVERTVQKELEKLARRAMDD